MKKAKQAFCLALSLVLVLCSLIGCNKSSSSSKASGQPASSAAADKSSSGAPEADNTKYDISIAMWSNVDSDNNPITKKLNELYNVNLKVTWFERSSWTDQLNTLLGTGTIPDVWMPTNASSHYVQGILAPFTIQMVKDNMPEFFEGILKYNKDFNVQTFVQGRFDGKNQYVLPAMQYTANTPMAMQIRSDWMANVGISKAPETIAEFETMLDQFTNGDPDKNGKKDTYGLTMRAKDAPFQMLMFLFNAYGTGYLNSLIYDKNGELVDSIMTDGYKAAVRKAHEWYTKGYIDPEFVTTDWKTIIAKAANNQLGIVDVSTWYRYIVADSDINAAIANIPNAKWSYVKPPKGPNGDYGLSVSSGVWGSVVFGVQLKDQPGKFARILQLINGLTSKVDVMKWACYGEEGVVWNMTDSGLVYTDSYKTPEQRKDVGCNVWGQFNGWGPVDVQKQFVYKNIDLNEILEKSTSTVHYASLTAGESTTAEEMAKFNEIKTNLDTARLQWTMQFILGDKDIDKDWNECEKELKDIGIEEYIQTLKKSAEGGQGVVDQVNKEMANLK